jgi:hypothetical protein
MAKYTIDIAERKVAAFGSNFFNNITDRLLGLGYVIPEGYEEKDEPEIIQLDYTDANGNPISYELPHIVACDPQLSKSVKITTVNDITGRVERKDNSKTNFIGGGEVIESWGNKGWDLTLRGLIVDMKNHNRPFDLITDFVNAIRENTIYEVRSSNLFNALGIGRIYITNVSLPTLEGFKDTQPYVITARSYVPAVLEITD